MVQAQERGTGGKAQTSLTTPTGWEGIGWRAAAGLDVGTERHLKDWAKLSQDKCPACHHVTALSFSSNHQVLGILVNR
ncbi:hypothetical protein CgunFtcFv8_013734 [Champsocephalus gunnari]|uniref:Uncharacterized protein n=1 Tax=Champsocephalus gunnari TaxID=52237 RepID=A0AAN8HV40_CHAGU|nr:hypothetical protein CgunFtcFv8_013734 [Champsocephalus gunnari]